MRADARFFEVAFALLLFVLFAAPAAAQTGVQVAPDGQTILLPRDTTGVSLVYTVDNWETSSIDIQLTCLEGLGVCQSVSPSSLFLGGGQSQNVTATFDAGSVLGVDHVYLEAVGNAVEDSTISDMGSYRVDIRDHWAFAVSTTSGAQSYELGTTGHQRTYLVKNTGLEENDYDVILAAAVLHHLVEQATGGGVVTGVGDRVTTTQHDRRAARGVEGGTVRGGVHPERPTGHDPHPHPRHCLREPGGDAGPVPGGAARPDERHRRQITGRRTAPGDQRRPVGVGPACRQASRVPRIAHQRGTDPEASPVVQRRADGVQPLPRGGAGDRHHGLRRRLPRGLTAGPAQRVRGPPWRDEPAEHRGQDIRVRARLGHGGGCGADPAA